jgi:hypothetical protein
LNDIDKRRQGIELKEDTSMIDSADLLQRRVARLEQRLRLHRYLTGSITILLTAIVTSTWTMQAQDSKILRLRSLIIEDDQGRERIVLGAPVPDPREGKRISPSVGMVINDENGYERFGLGLQANGRMGMGFDAPRNTGDDRNRERISIVADEQGGASVRFLDRRTLVAGYLRLDTDNQMWLEFLDVQPTEVITRRIGFKGEESTRRARQ